LFIDAYRKTGKIRSQTWCYHWWFVGKLLSL
jgi:hypothetical protein